MAIILKVTPEALQQKAEEVRANIQRLQVEFYDIQDIVSRTSGYWVGNSGDKARREFNRKKDDTDKVIRRFAEHPPELLAMAGIYTDTEQKIASEEKSLVTDVIV